MAPRQDLSSSSPPLVIRAFYVDHAKWMRLGRLAEARGTSRAAEIRALIDRELDEADRASWEPAKAA